MSRKDLFTGRSGQLALLAEFLIRQMNVAIPEVDVGDDVIVVRDDLDEITRVQVKSANAKQHKNPANFTATFKIPLKQLEEGPQQLVYAFVVRRNDRWEEFVMVRRSVLFELHSVHGLGSAVDENNLMLRLSFAPADIQNKNLSLQPFRSCFQPWPPPAVVPDGVIP